MRFMAVVTRESKVTRETRHIFIPLVWSGDLNRLASNLRDSVIDLVWGDTWIVPVVSELSERERSFMYEDFCRDIWEDVYVIWTIYSYE